MSTFPTSDLASSLSSQSQSRMLKALQTQHTSELVTGRVDDAVKHLKGDMSNLSSLVREQALQEQYISNNTEVAQMADVMQLALDTVTQSADDMLDTVIIGPQSNLPQIAEIGRNQAISTFDKVFSAMNVQTAGRFLFGGINVSQPPMPDLETALTAIDNALTGATNMNDIIVAVDAFFDVGGGFETLLYQGSTTDLSPIPLDERETVSFDLRADNDAIRSAIKSAAYVYAAGSSAIGLSLDEQNDLLVYARDATLNSKESILQVQGDLGFKQERIEGASVRLQTQKSEAEKAEGYLLNVDSFDAATQLEEVNNRLDLLYATTARASRLSFLEYM